jgi:hypothetical protein
MSAGTSGGAEPNGTNGNRQETTPGRKAMKFMHGKMHRWALPLVAAGLCAMLSVAARARDAN